MHWTSYKKNKKKHKKQTVLFIIVHVESNWLIADTVVLWAFVMFVHLFAPVQIDTNFFWGWPNDCFGHGFSGCVLHYHCSLLCISTPYLIRWKVSQYMNTGCAAAMAMVKYIRSWFLAPRTRRPSTAASDRIFNLSVRIYSTHR